MAADRMRDRISGSEISKDSVQSVVEAAAGTVGQVAMILTGAVRDVATAVGGLATEVYEIRDSSRRAAADQADPEDPPDGDGR